MNRYLLILICSIVLMGCVEVNEAVLSPTLYTEEEVSEAPTSTSLPVTPTLAPDATFVPTNTATLVPLASVTALPATSTPPAPAKTVQTVLRPAPLLHYSNGMDSEARRRAAIEATTLLEQWLLDAWAYQADISEVKVLLTDAGWINQETDVIEADMDGDGRSEWLFTLFLDGNQPYQFRFGDFWIVDSSGVQFRYYQPEEYFSAPTFLDRAPMATAVQDFTGDDVADLLLNKGGCGAHTCWDQWRFYTIHDGSFENRIHKTTDASRWGGTYLFYAQPELDAIEMPSASARVSNEGVLPKLIVDGGQVGSAGAGIQRQRTETWGWTDRGFALVDLSWYETKQRIHILWEANDMVDRGRFDEAIELYNEAIGNEALLSYEGTEADFYGRRWQPIAQFAAFRLALIGYGSEKYNHIAHTVAWMNDTYPDAILTEAANQLLTYHNRGLHQADACQVITENLRGVEDELILPIEYGYANPVLTVEDVCPVD